MKRIIAAIFALALLGGAGVATAADFTFNIPVNIQNAHPDVDSATVLCRVFKVRGNYTADNVVATSSRSGAARLPIDSSGNYRGTFTVTAETESGKNPVDGRYYECDLVFNGYDLNSDTRARGAPFESRPGTTRTIRVNGDIPR